MKQDDLPLFAWHPPCKLIVFPLVARIGRIRDVASKMLDKTSARAAETYRDQVTIGVLRHLERLGLSESEQDEQLGAFWNAVGDEMARERGRVSRKS
ncbi:hypothetical protein ELI00_05255 [Rhizobium ruizarguesonis]|uniref:DUF6074 family protein n=1 Tax=Rhizobium ruizarguesonis TaxID=2081791 RepID=UPI0010312CC0|nr:DUF6074 family protein [Rhizobium ruizarguesonis]TAX75700.1 hypothetical protein ELI00_05255 [Rhizobium ruizarguesonis]